jgi:hypothetical protein
MLKIRKLVGVSRSFYTFRKGKGSGGRHFQAWLDQKMAAWRGESAREPLRTADFRHLFLITE